MHTLGAASIVALMAAAGPAQAQGVTAKDILSHYNLVTTGMFRLAPISWATLWSAAT
jgi:hypothetical protein